MQLRRKFAELRAAAQTHLRQLEDRWWQKLAAEIQGYADTNNLHKFYESIKCIYGPTKISIVPVRNADSYTLARYKEGKH